MEQTTLLADATNLTLFGMGFVFVFLSVLVFITKSMSFVVIKLVAKPDANASQAQSDLSLNDEIDEETKFVIEQAIKMHRGA